MRSSLSVSLCAVVGFVFLGATGASATTLYYADIMTSDPLGNVHATVTHNTDFDWFDAAAWDVSVNGGGLGSALIPPSKTFTLTLDGSLGTIEQAWLYVALTDDIDPWYDPLDPFGMHREYAVVEFGGSSVTTEVGLLDPLLAPIFADVTATVLSAPHSVTITVESTGGDFAILGAGLKARISTEGTPGSAVPEPTSALLFACGALLVARVRHR